MTARASPSSAAGSPGSRRRSSAPTRRGRDAVRGADAARRRDVLGRAQRPLARQRPARRAPLLHRVPRRSCAGSASSDLAPAAAAAARPGPARGQAAGVHHAHRPAGAAPPRARRCSATRRCARASGSPRSRAALALASSTPTTRRSTSRRSATGCARTASRANAIAALWNLIALPTLNLPADDASLARGGEGVPHRACSTRPTRADIGVPTVPLQRLHGDAAAAALERAGGADRRSARRSARSSAGPASSLLDDGADEADAVDRRRPARGGRRSSLPPGAVDADALDGARHEPDREPARPLRPPRARRAVRGRRSARRCSGSSTAPRPSGVARGPAASPSRSRTRVDEIGEPVATLRERYLPALERLLPAARGAERARLHRHARAARDVPRRARARARLRPGAAHRRARASTSPARGRTPAGRRRWRAPSAAALAAARAALADLAAAAGAHALAGGTAA